MSRADIPDYELSRKRPISGPHTPPRGCSNELPQQSSFERLEHSVSGRRFERRQGVSTARWQWPDLQNRCQSHARAEHIGVQCPPRVSRFSLASWRQHGEGRFAVPARLAAFCIRPLRNQILRWSAFVFIGWLRNSGVRSAIDRQQRGRAGPRPIK